MKDIYKKKDHLIKELIALRLRVDALESKEAKRKKLEAQLIQAQKMEAVGQLAGGIAHDFNNLLTAIIGYGHLLKPELSKNIQWHSYVQQILSAAERAANLTNDLLTFSRKQIINPRPVNLNNIINDMGNLLTRIIGEDIEFSTVLTDKDLPVMVDNTQIEQVWQRTQGMPCHMEGI